MKKIDFKSLYTPFVGSPAHILVAIFSALVLAAGIILSAHLILHKNSAPAPETAAIYLKSEVAR